MSVVLTSACYPTRGSTLKEVPTDNLRRADTLALLPIRGYDNAIALQAILARNDKSADVILDTGRYEFHSPVYYSGNLQIRGQGAGTIVEIRESFLTLRAPKMSTSTVGTEKSRSRTSISNCLLYDPYPEDSSLLILSSTEPFEEKDVEYNKIVSFSSANSNSLSDGKQAIRELCFRKPLTVERYAYRTFDISNLTVSGGESLYLISATAYSDSKIEKIDFVLPTTRPRGKATRNSSRIAGTSAIALYSCSNVGILGCHFENCWYGVLAHKGCYRVEIRECKAIGCRHINNFALGSYQSLIENSTAVSCYGGFDSHQTALSSAYINCVDSLSDYPSKFRGRYDSITMSKFDGGIEMYYDSHIIDISDRVKVGKLLHSSYVVGSGIKLSGPNISVSSCTLEAPVETSRLHGSLNIHNSKFLWSPLTPKKFSAALIIGSSYSLEGASSIMVSNCLFDGVTYESTSPTIGIYMQGSFASESLIHNCAISNFTTGLVMYGGVKASEGYDHLVLDSIRFKNCLTGILEDSARKDFRHRSLAFLGCQTNWKKLL